MEDLEFAAESGSDAVLQLFVCERRRLAFEWMKRAAREAAEFLRLPVGVPIPGRRVAEFQLLTHLASFVLVYQLWAAMVHLYGLVRARAVVRCVRPLAWVLAKLGGRISGSLTLNS